MTERIQKGGLQVATQLHDLVESEILPGTGIGADSFWPSFEAILNELTPKNRDLLAKREVLQSQINEWHLSRKGQPQDADAYRAFLTDIGYLVPEGGEFQITTASVDPEISEIAGPQLVVPVMNARYALNAANARWGSLYDALYGSDVISGANGAAAGDSYNPARGAKVIEFAAQFLDEAAPLAAGSHDEATGYALQDGGDGKKLIVSLVNGSETRLASEGQFAGYIGDDAPTSVLLKNNGLHIELQVDRTHPVGKGSAAGIKDVVLEAAITTIQDCEDSVAAVDAEDKVLVYRNWLGLMKGDLETTFAKNSQPLTRRLNDDRVFTEPDGSPVVLHGRSLLLVRNVGHLMTTDAVLDRNGDEIPEGMLDAMVTSLCALHDLKGNSSRGNSRAGGVYIVKPKMHGPEEVAFTAELFGRVEDALGMAPNTLKIGVMDEERRKINVYYSEDGPKVYGAIQKEIIPILK